MSYYITATAPSGSADEDLLRELTGGVLRLNKIEDRATALVTAHLFAERGLNVQLTRDARESVPF